MLSHLPIFIRFGRGLDELATAKTLRSPGKKKRTPFDTCEPIECREPPIEIDCESAKPKVTGSHPVGRTWI